MSRNRATRASVLVTNRLRLSRCGAVRGARWGTGTDYCRLSLSLFAEYIFILRQTTIHWRAHFSAAQRRNHAMTNARCLSLTTVSLSVAQSRKQGSGNQFRNCLRMSGTCGQVVVRSSGNAARLAVPSAAKGSAPHRAEREGRSAVLLSRCTDRAEALRSRMRAPPRARPPRQPAR